MNGNTRRARVTMAGTVASHEKARAEPGERDVTIPAESFFLDPGFSGTLQQQIRQLVTDGILAGHLRPGDRMPSTRGLAARLGVSRVTVTLAYTELVSNDFLDARDRSGYYVSARVPPPPTVRSVRRTDADTVDWSRAIGQRFSGYRRLARPSDWHGYRYPFIYGQVDASLFDHQNWRLCALMAFGQREFSALTADYYERDDEQLVGFITRHILPGRGIAAMQDEVLLTLGAQNALWLAAQVLLNQRRVAAIENPCYPELREILQQTRCRVACVDVDKAGLPPEALPSALDVVFTTTSHHCPTNATMPLSRRRQLLDLALRDGFIVVEDDYEFEMSLVRSSPPALKSLDRAGAVVYIGSFSKSVFPGLRLGYLVGPAPFIREVRALRALVLRHPPGQIQRTLAHFLGLGHYHAQLRRIGEAYARRRKVMDRAIREYGLDVAAHGAFGGSSFWMRAPHGVNMTEVAPRLRSEGVLIEPGRVFFGPLEEDHSHYRLAYSSIPEARIPEGIERIAHAIHRAA